jgi:hypothetical protein
MTQAKRAQGPARNSEDRVKVRTTMRPDVELEVTEAERLDLAAQGLLKDPTKKES